MGTSRFAAAALITWTLAACASPQSRIKKHRTEFDSYPPAVQKLIQDGRADVGFTTAQAEMALGRPDRIYTRTTAAAAQEVWAYGGASRAGVGFSFGLLMGGPVSVGTGIGVGPDAAPADRLRLVFQDGAVVSVEKIKP